MIQEKAGIFASRVVLLQPDQQAFIPELGTVGDVHLRALAACSTRQTGRGCPTSYVELVEE